MRLLFHIFYLIVLCSQILLAQDYEEFDTLSRNDFVIHISKGLGLYYLNNNDPNNQNVYTTTNILNFGASYFIAKNTNVGFSFTHLKFPANKDSAQNAISNLMGLCVRYQTLKSKKTNIYFGLNIGTSTFKFTSIKTNTRVTSGSLFLEPNIGFSHYWGKHIGIFLQSSYYYTKYDKIVNKENEPLQVTVNGKKENFWLSLSGIELKLGLLFKF